MKELYPIQISDYTVHNKISEEPELAWWTKHVLKKRDQIVSKTASIYWKKIHKYGIQIPKTVKEAVQINKNNGDTWWWDAILQIMKNVRPSFEAF